MTTDDEVLKTLDFPAERLGCEWDECKAPALYLTVFHCCDNSIAQCGLHKTKMGIAQIKDPDPQCTYCNKRLTTITHNVVGVS